MMPNPKVSFMLLITLYAMPAWADWPEAVIRQRREWRETEAHFNRLANSNPKSSSGGGGWIDYGASERARANYERTQEIARKALTSHPAVLNDPEPSILVEALDTSTVNLRVYFWLNGREYSWMKVRSSIIRLVKLALQQQGFRMPPSIVQEIAVLQGPPMTGLDGKPRASQDADSLTGKDHPVDPAEETPDAVSTKAEAGLYSEAVVIEEQARQAQPLKDGENLLPVASAAPPSGKQPEEPMF